VVKANVFIINIFLLFLNKSTSTIKFKFCELIFKAEKFRPKWKENIKMGVKMLELEDVEWSILTVDRNLSFQIPY
jgi:hypothetical protein